MQTVSLPVLIMASINFYMGAYHMFVYIKRREMAEHFTFALLCFCVCLYDLFCIGLYNSRSVEQGVFWQRLQLDVVCFVSIFQAWFIAQYTKRTSSMIIRFYTFSFVILFILTFIPSPDLTLSASRPSVKEINFLNYLKATYYESELGLIYTVGVLFSITCFMYLLIILFKFYFKTKEKRTLIMIISQSTYFVGATNDTCVASGLYQFIYLQEYAFFAVVLAMSYLLLSDFVKLHTEVEEMNTNLESKVIERTSQIDKLNEELRHMAEYDALTGIYNRRFFNEYFEIEVKRAKNHLDYNVSRENDVCDMNFGLAMIDIDDFKKINDTYGHLVGDKVLIETVKIIKESIFTRDILCRYGGEEFTVIFTRTSKDGIRHAAEKIRKNIEDHIYMFNEQYKNQHVTVSIGVVIFNEVSDNRSEYILKIADERLYEAKRAGKNRTMFTNLI